MTRCVHRATDGGNIVSWTETMSLLRLLHFWMQSGNDSPFHNDIAVISDNISVITVLCKNSDYVKDRMLKL